MQLTQPEQKALEQANKMDARWPKTRWIALALGLTLASIGIIDTKPTAETGIVFGIGILQLLTVARLWKGRPILKLLLKFAEKNEEKPN
jgi:hypothetical protein